MEIDLPPVRNPFLADPPSLPLRLMYVAMARASVDYDDESRVRYERLVRGRIRGDSGLVPTWT